MEGRLPQLVDGRDFPAEAAELFDAGRRPIRMAAEVLMDRVGNARDDELLSALERRSAVQFLMDDFRGTVADGLADDILFADGEDAGFAERLRNDGPLDVRMPPHLPASHWWWASAMVDKPAAGIDDPADADCQETREI